ncbi:hypothetical protein [Microbacterium sp. A93]|uniref:hypothetical protein n=1 Tax=Microbacterium sp. A93 TaxID=3450716 RepID=UPI003F42329F
MSTDPINPESSDEERAAHPDAAEKDRKKDKKGPETEEELDEQVEESMPASDPPANY